MWKGHLISHLFDLFTTNLIMNTPLFHQVTTDMFGMGEKNDQY